MANFTAISGDDKWNLQFVLDGQKSPIKLGDGTFGCVFRVRNSAFKEYALKIFYESTDKFVLTSQVQEMNLGSNLREHFWNQNGRIAEIDRYLVVSKAHVGDFKSSEAYKSFKNYFEKLAFKVSDKAIVMDIYPVSLKDVLERGWSTSESSEEIEKAPDTEASTRATGSGSGENSGYSILLNIPQTEREKCILPIVRQIAEALSILQDAKFNHQDIKPANILLRKVGPEIEVALADLGFINTGQFQVHGSMYQKQPMGTRHYRSPEQTDYFDICEVDIRHLEDGDYKLTTHDPKFHSTFSESGDLVVFSKLPEHIQWEIKEVTLGSSQEGGSGISTIHIKNLQCIELHDDVRTQITIYKRQTDRTDLFGLGAIIFDMLTCGRSPEQFYDLLRVHNREGKIEKGLAQRYVHFKNGGGTIPEIDAIFQNMRVDANSEFPHPDIVKIILKCMMSRPSDSYWNSGRWKDVKADLDALIKKLGCRHYYEARSNHLANSDISPDKKSRQSTTSVEDDLREIQGLSYSNAGQCIQRLVLGIRYLDKIAQMVKTEIGDSPDLKYLANIAPNSLDEYRGAYVPRLVFFEKKEDFDAVIESGNPRALVQLFSAGGLRPPFINHLVLEGEVWLPKGQQRKEPEGDSICLGYEMRGREGGRFGEKVEGCRLLLDFSITDRVNREITKVDLSQGVLYIRDQDDLAKKLSVDTGRYGAFFVDKFDRTHYYLSMLGVYIRQIFFVDPDKDQMHMPHPIYFFEEGRPLNRTKFKDLPSLPPPLRNTWFSRKSKSSNELLNILFLLMAGISARLLTLEIGTNPPRGIVDNLIGRLKDDIAMVLGCNSRDELMTYSITQITQNSRNNLSIDEFPNIDKFVNMNIVSS